MKALIEVADPAGNITTRRVPDVDVPDHVADVIGRAVEELAVELAMPAGDVAAAMAGEAVLRVADETAYRRVAERRGVLPL